VVARSAFGDDSGYVSVVPHGRVLAAMHFEGGGSFVQFDLDGSHYRTVPTLVGQFDAGPVWAPDGKHFLYHNYDASLGALELWVADTTGQASRLWPRGTFHSVGFARFSRDGRWLYFSVGATDNTWSIWRSHPDGSGAVQLTTGTPWAQRPDPSPDDSRVAFRTQGGIRVSDLATGQASPWVVNGLEPRWSPTGERIAVMPDGVGPLMIVSADGTNPHPITAANTNFGWQLYDHSFDWSPDGKWLVVSYNYMIQLLQVDTGLLLPLAWSVVAGQPSWQP
jgi:Tol biopolymer transport system component